MKPGSAAIFLVCLVFSSSLFEVTMAASGFCGSKCECKCVPSGTYGNKHECPCYRDMKNSKGKPECP
ncbi:hypothetical protein SADUNF_Sadunf09G0026700 [Salix dunnii]|uniref:Uncharacterized protein n=1 Tax=Salix dunnii TaxID=1413687 RepID=A0A835JV32_9ROSI|nr:hypothetical protein SADUNF_Sadunf09G0026700 [Salix dunnii]